MAVACPHLAAIRPVEPRTPDGCEECLQIGSPWVHLRLCLTCGHVGCCDSSPNRHAHAIGNPSSSGSSTTRIDDSAIAARITAPMRSECACANLNGTCASRVRAGCWTS